MSGLLSTLNENAQEDVLLEEIKQAREEADKPFSDRGGGGLSETEETDVLYYTNPSSASTQNIDVLSGSSNVDLEKVLVSIASTHRLDMLLKFHSRDSL